MVNVYHYNHNNSLAQLRDASTMRAFRQVCLATTLLALASAPAAAQANRAEVLHWWTSGGESAAVKVFADQFEAAGGDWVDTAIAGGPNARTAGINRIVGGNPPTVMQFNTGKQFDELVANDLLRDVDQLAEEGKWREIMPKPIVDAVVRDDHFYAVPVNIHGQNWLFYNVKLFQDAGLEPPKTWPELITDGQKLKERGVIPVALGGQPNWEHALFRTVLVGHGGADLFRKIYGDSDTDAVQGDTFKEVAEIFGQMRKLVDPGSPGRNWNDATALVITGKAAMHFMGDWAKGEFTAAGLSPGKDYGCSIVGEGGELVIGGDVFVFPKTDDEAVRAAQDKMAQVMLDPKTQLEFNKKKGSIPVRLDVDVSSMDECAQKGAKALADPSKQVESMELLSTPDLSGALHDVITQYWNNPSMDVDTFVESFVSAVESAS
jgi:glucose/mannose transport system substrate-binding protein